MTTHQPPLATRMRPQSLTDIVGQTHLVGDGQILRRMVDAKQLSSIILYGPPGVGKTSIAHALSNDFGLPFEYFNAGVHAKKVLQDAISKGTPDKPVIVLVDEVHRLDKPKQDYLLMHMEEGSVIMVGATTENPYMSINPAVRSRCHIFELQPVSVDDIAHRLQTSLQDNERGLGYARVIIEPDDVHSIAAKTNGDVRRALNTLELIVKSTAPADDGHTYITRDIINACVPQQDIGGDKDGDSHYNLLSAFQKAIRGSDADAALHYLARLIQAGDLISINRRLLVIAFEDISLAEPSLGPETLAAITTAERVGLPEARIPLAHITVRLALSPKSNVAYKALDRAITALNTGRDLSVPKHLQDAHYKGASTLGRGVDYKYPHDYPYGITAQRYLPEEFAGDQYLQFRDETDTEHTQRTYRTIQGVIQSE